MTISTELSQFAKPLFVKFLSSCRWIKTMIMTDYKLIRIKNFKLFLNSPDRLVLENTIIPYFTNRDDIQRILFVGCEWYTKSYSSFFPGKEYWTIEVNPKYQIFGSKNHIIDKLQNLDAYIDHNFFDLIVYNGVFGWGINTREDTEQSFQQCFKCLRAGGVLIFGWNDVPEHKPFPVMEECESLKQFQPYLFPPLNTKEYLVPECKHLFNFFIKPPVNRSPV